MDPTKKRKLEENGVVSADSDTGTNKITAEDAHKIIESFTREQLFEIVKNAAVRHTDVLDAVRSFADRDPAQRKLFIRGLGWETTTEKLRAVFSTYGDLAEAVVILDKATGKSKGYGFVTFLHIDGALLALKEPSKNIDGRITVSQLAAAGVSGPTGNAQATVDASTRKIYVGDVPYDMPADRLLAHFLSYGEIEEGPLGYDKATGKSKGYALFVYKTAEGARASLVDPIKSIDGKNVTCKLANDWKKGGKPGVAGPGGVQGPTGVPGEAHGDGIGLHAPASMPGSLAAQYGGPGGPGGISSYGGFSGGLQGPPPLGLGNHHLNSSLGGGPGLSSVSGGPGLSSIGSQAPSSVGVSGGYGSGLGGPYAGSLYSGPGSTGYGGFAGAGGGLGGTGGSGLVGAGSGLGGAGRGSSLYGIGLPPSSVGMPSGESAHYSLSGESALYSLSLSGYPSQHHQQAGTSPVPRVPPGGMYQGMPPYY
uniref:Putative UBP1-associated protein 2C n=1 Tax=Davidia involucrata TaxID=16924 RepID=A0A5B7BMV3_DAVIN